MPFLRTRCSQRLIFEYWRNFLLPNTPDCVTRIKFKPVFSPSKFEPLSTSRSPSCCFCSLYWAFYSIDRARALFCVFDWAWSGFPYT